MPSLTCPADEAFVVVIDIQPTFMAAIHEAERVVRRSRFLIEIATLLQVPVISTVQYPSRMGGLDPQITEALIDEPISKMSFSCYGTDAYQNALEVVNRPKAVLVGIETHICVTLTALDLLQDGYEVFVCPDAVSSRSMEMHKLGMERMRDSGVMPSHTETLAYEWMRSAEHPQFREALKIVKESAS